RRLIKGSLVFVSVYLTCRITFDFSSTLTTMTLYQCRLKGFASTYCKANAVGLPPSLAKLRKLFCRYATILFALGTPYKVSSGGTKGRNSVGYHVKFFMRYEFLF